jgi:superfamily II DNA or RNA helicase
MFSDFKDYSSRSNWDVESNCHTIFAGREKQTDKRVVISTWQSIYKLPEKYFDQFECVLGDECHLFKSKSLTTLMTKLTKCPYRIGTTGTLDGTMTHKLVIEGLFGPVFNVTSTKTLMDKDLLSTLKIECLLIKHPKEIRNELKKVKYQDEIDWIVRNKDRNEFIKNLAINLKGNTLVLFQFVEKHGKYLHSIVEDASEKNRSVFFVHGGTDVDMREKIRHITEKESNAIIVASYGTFSTGISIRKLHNIIFASPSKSRIRVLQSIGRQLRKSEHKDVAKLYDVGDDLSWKSYKNHTLKHFEERVKIYKSENFDYDIISVNI